MTQESFAAIGVQTERIASGFAGLDEVLGDGYPKRHFYIREGNSGAGKTTLALPVRDGGRGTETEFCPSLLMATDEKSKFRLVVFAQLGKKRR